MVWSGPECGVGGMQLSSNEASFRVERLYVNKLNIILVQVRLGWEVVASTGMVVCVVCRNWFASDVDSWFDTGGDFGKGFE